jgi:hypothetical protein|eukprot:COSAG01_NODE_14969_length_1390_cov_1.577847_2_plen_93_part_00
MPPELGRLGGLEDFTVVCVCGHRHRDWGDCENTARAAVLTRRRQPSIARRLTIIRALGSERQPPAGPHPAGLGAAGVPTLPQRQRHRRASTE